MGLGLGFRVQNLRFIGFRGQGFRVDMVVLGFIGFGV